MSRTEYAYTTGDLANVTATNTFSYVYDEGWKDQLVEVKKNGATLHTFSYDQVGNPTTYKGASLTWARGRNMATYHIEGDDQYFDMCYDASGKRASKHLAHEDPAENEVTTYYIYDGNNLICEKKDNGGTISYRRYLYNSQGVIGYVIGSTVYTYRKNLFGDIVAIYQGSTKVAEYAYDAWGNCTIVSDSWNIGASNPFRYRGYYWDEDLQLYYLMSRYYDPATGRFISPARISSLNPQAINGFNLYSYAGNNPIVLALNRLNNTNKIKEDILTKAPDLSSNLAQGSFATQSNNPNKWSLHWENKWFETGLPSFCVLSEEGLEIINWGLSVYRGNLYLDDNESHSIYVSLGNISTYLGIHYKKGSGVDFSASVIEIGYDGPVIDANIELISWGFTYMYKDGKMHLKQGYGWFGWSISIDFVGLIKCLFGGN